MPLTKATLTTILVTAAAVLLALAVAGYVNKQSANSPFRQ